MKKILLTLTSIVTLFLAINVHAGTNYSSTQIGNHTFYSGDLNATSTRIGNNTFYSGDVTGSSTRIGNNTFYNLD